MFVCLREFSGAMLGGVGDVAGWQTDGRNKQTTLNAGSKNGKKAGIRRFGWDRAFTTLPRWIAQENEFCRKSTMEVNCAVIGFGPRGTLCQQANAEQRIPY